MAGLKRSIKRKLRAQMEKEFGESVYGFWQRTMDGPEQTLSYETVARIMSEGRDDKKSVDFGTLLTVCRSLDFSRDEIRAIMREHDQSEGRQQDRGLWQLIGDTVNELSNDEMCLVEAYRAIKRKKPEVISNLAESVDLVCKVAGVALDLSPLKRKET